MENSTFVSDSELTDYINTSYYELYDLLVQTYEDYFITGPTAFSLTSSDSGVYALPSDFFKLKGLDFKIGGDWVSVPAYNWNTRNIRQRALYNTVNGTPNVAYRIVGSNLNATGDYQLWYIPSLTALSASTDTLNTQITRNGWEEYVVVDTAIKMLAKEESDTRHLLAEKNALIRRLESAAAERDVDSPEQVTDMSGHFYQSIDGYRW
jgi:hypothetical protein